jgi:hypothetical protein
MKLQWVLIFVGIWVSSISKSFIYEIRILKQWNQRYQRFDYVIGKSDFHDKSHPATHVQEIQLQNIMARCNKQSTKLIIEDLSSHDINGRAHSCGPFVINSQGGILGGLTQRCEQKGFHVDNVEYRYCRVASLGPVINNIEQVEMPFQSTHAISVGLLLQEIEDNIKEIKTFNDGKRLNALYERIVRDVKIELAKLKLHETRHSTVAHFMAHNSTKENRLDVLNNLLTVDGPLLDIKIMHSIKNAQKLITTPRDDLYLFVIGGGSHILRVCNWLVQHDNWHHVYATPIIYGREYDVLKCIGSPMMQGGYCMRPEPTDLDIVMRYIRH